MANPYEEFIERAYKLETSRFWAWMRSRRMQQPEWDRLAAGDWLAHEGLNPDELDAFCLNLRLLIQDADGFSIRKIRQLSEGWSPKHDLLKREIRAATDELAAMLDEQCLVSLTPGARTTNREIFDVFFYGGIVHATPGKREQFESIVKSGIFSYFAFNSFRGVIFHYRNCVVQIAHQIAKYLHSEEEQRGAG